MKKNRVFAFIDSQNLNLSVSNDVKDRRTGRILYKGWKLDFQKFFVYLKDKYEVIKTFLFIGYLPGNESLYTYLQKSGYLVVFKPTLIKQDDDGKKIIKGNVDAELVLHTMIEWGNYDKAIIVAGDGDYHCLIEYLEKKGKLQNIIIPNRYSYSSLLRRFRNYFEYVNDLRNKLEDEQKKRGSNLRTKP